MIRDYKFDPAFDDGRRRKNLGRVLIVSAVLLGAGSVYWYLGLSKDEAGSQLATAADELPIPVAVPAQEKRFSQPLNLPRASQLGEIPSPANLPPSAKEEPPVTELSLLDLRQEKDALAGPAETTASVQSGRKPIVAEDTAPATKVEQKPGAEMGPQWLSHTISSGESLATIFKAKSLSANLLHRIVNSSKTAKQLARIRPGQELRFLLDDENGLEELVLVKSPVESLHIRAGEDTFAAELVSKNVERRIASAAGTIESSLFVDGQKAGLSDAQIMELAALFGWDIDFALEIRSGDQFRLLYEEQYLGGEKYQNGPILAAEFVNKGNVYQAFRFEQNEGEIGYYDADGRNKRRAFIRTPVKFARVSSGFTNKRWHPVLKRWRSHKGVDYAAPTGTPIKATGSGKVIFRGWKGGYGRVVIVQHGSKYSTLYAHMSKFSSKAKAGSKVKQGQIVGYVGKSGLATGPHLHYEFRVNGVHKNPLTVKLPKSLPLPDSQLAAFKKQTEPLVAQLESIAQKTMVASSEH